MDQLTEFLINLKHKEHVTFIVSGVLITGTLKRSYDQANEIIELKDVYSGTSAISVETMTFFARNISAWGKSVKSDQIQA